MLATNLLSSYKWTTDSRGLVIFKTDTGTGHLKSDDEYGGKDPTDLVVKWKQYVPEYVPGWP